MPSDALSGAINVSKAPAVVVAHTQNHQDTLTLEAKVDLQYDKPRFHCKLCVSVRLRSAKSVYIYFVLEPNHIQSLEVHDSEIPDHAVITFVKKHACSSASDILGLRFSLSQAATLIGPRNDLHLKPESRKTIDLLLRVAATPNLTVYLPSKLATSFSDLRDAVNSSKLQPDVDFIRTLYAGAGGKAITSLADLCSRDVPEHPPAYDKAVGSKKRRIESTELDESTAKQTRVETGDLDEPWKIAVAAQAAQLAALTAQVEALRGELQSNRVPMIDAATQTGFSELEPLCQPSPSQASTVEDSVEDRVSIIENSITDIREEITRLDVKLKNDITELKRYIDDQLNEHVALYTNLEEEVGELRGDIREDMQGLLEDEVSGIQIKLQEYAEEQMAILEQNIKDDIRNAFSPRPQPSAIVYYAGAGGKASTSLA